MLTLDPRSIILVTALMAFMFFFILFGLNRSLPKQLPGLREGVLCAFAWFVGIGEILLRGVIPDWLSIIGGNTAITLGIVEIYAYLHLSAGRAVSARRLLWLAGVISLAALAALTYYGRYSYILTFTSGSNAVLLGACAVQSFLLSRSSPAERLTSTSLACASLISLARFLVSALGVETVSGAFDPTMFQKAYFSLIGCSIIAMLTGVTLTTYDRLRALLADANRSLELQVAERTRELIAEITVKEDLERAISTTADAERRRIGHELHDDLGQRLTGISLVAESLARRLAKNDASLSAEALTIGQAASEAIAQVRLLAHGLMPVGPEPDGFREALSELARSTSAGGIPCDFEHDIPVDIKNQDVATNLFRIAQEAIANAVRHARATALTVRLDRVEGKVCMTIADNGAGFRRGLAPRDGGRGLGIMEFRAGLIQYRLGIESAPGRGCTVRVAEC